MKHMSPPSILTHEVKHREGKCGGEEWRGKKQDWKWVKWLHRVSVQSSQETEQSSSVVLNIWFGPLGQVTR